MHNAMDEYEYGFERGFDGGVESVLDYLIKKRKEEDDGLVEGILESLITSCEKHKEIESLIFILKDHDESQKILSYIAANILTAGAISKDRRITKSIYNCNVEERMRNIFYRDMRIGEFKYLSIIIDALTVEKIKEITMNRKPYLEIIKNILQTTEQMKSSLLSRELGLCLVI